jgi:PncC family amidohydrolase
MTLNLAAKTVQELKRVGHILSTVESCTGGLVASRITDIAGASAIFFGSSVVYDNAAKQELGLEGKLIDLKGAVSREVAQGLAELGLKKMQKNVFLSQSYALIKPRGFICVSTTGIAGPTGGSEEKPVGLCFIGLASSEKPMQLEAFQIQSPQDRLSTKNLFAERALELLIEYLSGVPSL